MTAKAVQREMEESIKNSLCYRVRDKESISAMLECTYVDCSAEDGTVILSHRINKCEVNIYGTLHGGIITWLMDTTMGTLGRAYTGYETLVTMDIHVNFLNAMYVDELALIKARITHSGRKVINVVSEMYVGEKLCATADALFYNVASSGDK